MTKKIAKKFQYALLSILRNMRRNLISLIVIALGCTSLMIFGGFVDSIKEGLRESLIHSQLGHLQIFKKGYMQYHSVDPVNYLIDKALSNHIESLFYNEKNMISFAKRFHFIGLISNGFKTGNFSGIGIDPDKEFELTTAIYLKDGEELVAAESNGALLGEGLARAINANIGDTLTILATTLDGAMNALDIEVKGIFTTGISDLDERLIRMNLPYVQKLIDSDHVTKYVVLLNDTEKTEEAKKSLLNKSLKLGLDIEIKTWDELSDYYYQVVNFFNGIFNFIKIIVVIIIFISILSSMLMNIFERTNEIGTSRALGASKLDILIHFIIEGGVIGIFGSMLGVAIGLFLAMEITNAAITMPRPPGSSIDYPIRIFSSVSLSCESFVICFVSVLISSIYPAIRASNLMITKALRYA